MEDSDNNSQEIHEEEKKEIQNEEAQPDRKRKSRTRGTNKKKTKTRADDDQTGQRNVGGGHIFSLFMSGLPYEWNEEQIKEFFDNSKSIVKVNLPKYQDSGRCLGYAHVEFNSKKEYEQGLAKNKNLIGGRYIEISPSRGKNAKQVIYSKDVPPDWHTIYVGNLPYDITEDQVGDKFRKYGEITQIRFSHIRGRFKGIILSNSFFIGFAYVDFKYPESVKKSLELWGKDFKGRTLVVDFTTTSAKMGYKIRLHEDGNKMYNKGIKKEIAAKKKRKEKLRAKMEEWRDN